MYRSNKKSSRRSFLVNSGFALAGSTLLSQKLFAAASKPARSANTLKIGLIGCGGRGTGAAAQAIKADPDVVLTAMGDVFEDRLEEAYQSLQALGDERIKVDKANKFIGFDAYQRVIDSGVDVVLLATPPAFRPLHLTAAVDAGKHIFCEKPVAVDAPGVRKVLAAAKKARDKKLCLVSGFCFRYDFPNRATFQQVLDGEIGKVRSVSTFRNGGELWYHDRQPDWKEMTHQMRNWYYYNWLSGDFIVEQSVHSLDMMSWALSDVLPLRATGTGGRQTRVDPKYGNIYDHFAVEFDYPDNVKAFHFTRQQAGTTPRNSVDILGTDGNASIQIGSAYTISGKKNWKYNGKKNNMYQTQHDELFAAIRAGKEINDGEWAANSSMLAVLGRMVGYSGQSISWEEALQSNQQLGPDPKDYDWDLVLKMPPPAVPGTTKVLS